MDVNTISHWLQSLSAIMMTLGYPGVFGAMVLEGLGLPFPGDAFLAFYGYAIAQHDMNGIAVLCIGTLGYFAGVSIIYWLTRTFGNVILTPLYRYRVLSQTRMERTANMMDKYSAAILIPGRFLPGVRSLSTYACALAKMPYSVFSFYTLVGGLLWCGMWIGFGYWFGENMHTLLRHIQTTLMWTTVAVVFAALLMWVLRRLQAKADARNGD